MDVFDVSLSRRAENDLKKLPEHIVLKLWSWVEAIHHEGLRSVRKLPGYHDEPLKGIRKRQRSIRLSKAYRAIYRVDESSIPEIIEILEVTKHEY